MLRLMFWLMLRIFEGGGGCAMNWKKIGRALLFPHVAVLFLLLPVAAVLLVYAMTRLAESEPLRIASYLLAFYTLVLWCVRIPETFRFFKGFRDGNRYIRTWRDDPRLRINVTLSGSAVWNGAYAALQLGIGLYHRSAWFLSMGVYYALLAGIRLSLVHYTLRHVPGEEPEKELRRYRACGWVFLLMNLALTGMMVYMLRDGRTMRHHEITTIALAAYTFTSLVMAIVNVFRYRRYNSPAMSAAKAVSLAAACVSMLTLENVMLSTFSGAGMAAQTRTLFLALSGGTVYGFIIVMAVYMIVQANRRLRDMEK